LGEILSFAICNNNGKKRTGRRIICPGGKVGEKRKHCCRMLEWGSNGRQLTGSGRKVTRKALREIASEGSEEVGK